MTSLFPNTRHTRATHELSNDKSTGFSFHSLGHMSQTWLLSQNWAIWWCKKRWWISIWFAPNIWILTTYSMPTWGQVRSRYSRCLAGRLEILSLRWSCRLQGMRVKWCRAWSPRGCWVLGPDSSLACSHHQSLLMHLWIVQCLKTQESRQLPLSLLWRVFRICLWWFGLKSQ
jgi:hypothetical protein